jgi:hypothetical protein
MKNNQLSIKEWAVCILLAQLLTAKCSVYSASF